MSVIRAFIAIRLSKEIVQNLDEVGRQLEDRLPGIPIRWVPVGNIHLTTKFLGDVSVSNLELLKKILHSEVSRHAPFDFTVGSIGAFPSISRARVIWAGVEAPPELYALQRGIELEISRLGYAREKRKFSPHLTIGRVSRNASSNDLRRIRDVLHNCKIGYLGAARVRDVHCSA